MTNEPANFLARIRAERDAAPAKKRVKKKATRRKARTKSMSDTNNNGNPNTLVQKVWNYAHVLRDQGVSYGDYIEQITYLLFPEDGPGA